MRFRFLLTLVSLTVAACSSTPQPRVSDSLEVAESASAYALSVPASELVLMLPRSQLVHRRNDPADYRNRRYFFFEGGPNALTVSGWFEPERLFPGVAPFWQKETESYRKRGLPEPEDVSFAQVGDWQVIDYGHTLPGGNNTHLRAHLVRNGTWVDLHISVMTSLSHDDNRIQIRDYLKRIAVELRPQG